MAKEAKGVLHAHALWMPKAWEGAHVHCALRALLPALLSLAHSPPTVSIRLGAGFCSVSIQNLGQRPAPISPHYNNNDLHCWNLERGIRTERVLVCVLGLEDKVKPQRGRRGQGAGAFQQDCGDRPSPRGDDIRRYQPSALCHSLPRWLPSRCPASSARKWTWPETKCDGSF